MLVLSKSLALPNLQHFRVFKRSKETPTVLYDRQLVLLFKRKANSLDQIPETYLCLEAGACCEST